MQLLPRRWMVIEKVNWVWNSLRSEVFAEFRTIIVSKSSTWKDNSLANLVQWAPVLANYIIRSLLQYINVHRTFMSPTAQITAFAFLIITATQSSTLVAKATKAAKWSFRVESPSMSRSKCAWCMQLSATAIILIPLIVSSGK